MSDAALDFNSVATLTGALSSNGDFVTKAQIVIATHKLKVDDGTTGTDFGPTNALHDGNGRRTLIGVASRTVTSGGVNYIQGKTPVVAYVDSTGHLLINSA